MLTEFEARLVAREYRGQFRDDVMFQRSWERYFERARGRENIDDLRRWLANDLRGEAVMAIGLGPREPLVSTPNGVELSSCWHCRGRGFVRRELEPSHPDFGKALECPACRAGRRQCDCQRCQPRAEGQKLMDHTLCVDETGHDFEHPDACPKCEDAQVVMMRMPKGINHAQVLAGVQDALGVHRRRDEARTP